MSGESNVFSEARHIRTHICELREAPPDLKPIPVLLFVRSPKRRPARSGTKSKPDFVTQCPSSSALKNSAAARGDKSDLTR